MAQTVAPTTFGLDAHGGHGFESVPMSFLLSTPHLFSLSFPVPLFTELSIKGKSPKINLKKKKNPAGPNQNPRRSLQHPTPEPTPTSDPFQQGLGTNPRTRPQHTDLTPTHEPSHSSVQSPTIPSPAISYISESFQLSPSIRSTSCVSTNNTVGLYTSPHCYDWKWSLLVGIEVFSHFSLSQHSSNVQIAFFFVFHVFLVKSK